MWIQRCRGLCSQFSNLVVLNLYFITTNQFAWVMFQIKSMRTAYRKIFMCVDANAGSLEERLAEVVLFVFVYFFEVVGDLSSVFLGGGSNLVENLFCRSSMRNWFMFLLCVLCCSLFATPLLKIVAEYASLDTGMPLEAC